MNSRYNELLEKHQALQKEEQAEATPERIENVRTFIAEIVEAGKSVSDARQREQLRGLLRYWGAWVYDRTKEYPQAQLAPALIAITKAEEGRATAIRMLGGERNAAIAGGILLLVIAYGLIEGVRLAQAWTAVENSARVAVRYAVTGTFEEQYCDEATTYYLSHPVPKLTEPLEPADDTAIPADGASPDPANDCNIPKGIANYEQKTSALQDRARLLSIYEVARTASALAVADGVFGDYLQYLSNAGPTFDPTYRGDPGARGYFNIVICSNRPGVIVDPNTHYYADSVREDNLYPAACVVDGQYTDDAGDPGDRVWVTITYRHPWLLPFFSTRFVAEREAIVEKFRSSSNVILPGTPTETSTSVPVSSPTAAPLPTDTPNPPTITPSPTPTPTPTPGPSPTPGVVMMLQGHTDVVRALAFSPDGAVLASGGLDGTVRMWDVARLTPKHESPFAADQWIFSLVFSSNGSRLFIGTGLGLQGGGKLGVLDVEQNLLLLSTDKIFIDNVTSVTLDRFGTRLATGSIGSATDDDTVSLALWQPDSLSRVARYSDNPILALAFSADGNRLVYGGTDRSVYIRDLQTSKRITGPVKHNGFVRGVAFSPDDTLVVSVSEDGTARLWDAANLSPLATLQKNAVRVFAVAFSPDGRQLAAAGVSLDGQGLIELWDVEAARQGGPVEPFVLTYPVTKANQSVSQQNALAFRALAFSSDGRWLAASGDDPTVVLWSVR